MDDEVRRLVESEWEERLGVSRSDIRTRGVQAIAAELGANAAMSFLFGEKCFIVVPPEQLDKAAKVSQGVDPRDAFTEEFLRRVAGPEARVEGPSWHSYVSRRSFNGSTDDAVGLVRPNDDAFLEFLSGVDIADVTESGFSPTATSEKGSDTTLFWALRENGRIAALGNMSEWRGLNADVGVLTHPAWRGQGLATRLVATMVEAMLSEAGAIRYRAVSSNLPSVAVARRLGFEPFGQNYRARTS